MRKQVHFILKRNLESLAGNSVTLKSAMTVPPPTHTSVEAKKPSEVTKPNDQYFVLSEEFRIGLSKRLDPKNFSSLAFRQDELEKMIRHIDNPFQLLYLYEKNHRTFSTTNFVSFIKKIDYLNRLNGVVLPQDIKKMLAESMVKHAPHFLAPDAASTFLSLTSLGLSLSEPSIRAALQILKYHVNSFDMNELIRFKLKLQWLKKFSPSNKFSEEFEKAVGLVAQLKGGEIATVKQAISLLKFFHQSISENNFTATMNFINSEWYDIRDRDIKDLAKVLLEKKYWHSLIIKKIARFVVEANSNKNSAFTPEEFELFFKLFKQVRFYEPNASEILLNGLMALVKGLEENSEERSRIKRGLGEYCVSLSKKDSKLLEFVKENKLELNDE